MRIAVQERRQLLEEVHQIIFQQFLRQDWPDQSSHQGRDDHSNQQPEKRFDDRERRNRLLWVQPICRATIENRRPAPLSQHWISASFRVVVNLLNVFRGANRPEFRILDLYVPWIFVISLFGFLAAWLLIAILESTGLSRHIWHLPLFFLALVVLLSSIFGFVCFP